MNTGVLCSIANDYSPQCLHGQVKATVSKALLPPRLCVCPENTYMMDSACMPCQNGTFTRFPSSIFGNENHDHISDCLPPPMIHNMTPESPVPNSSNVVLFSGQFDGSLISLTMGLGRGPASRISSTTITAIPPQGITGSSSRST